MFHHRIGHIQGVAGGGLIHRKSQCLIAVLVDALHGEAVGAVAHLSHVLELQQVARGGTVDDQVVEVLQGGEVAVVLHHDRVGVGLIA